MSEPVVGIAPRSLFAGRPRFFSAIEQAFAVTVEPRDLGDWKGLRGAIVVGGEADAPSHVPSLLIAPTGEPSDGDVAVTFAVEPDLDPRLRGRVLVERRTGLRRVAETERGKTLATSSLGPIWVSAPRPVPRHIISGVPQELDESESLRDRIKSGDFAAAVPLVHFLRAVERRQSSPPLRAAFVLDDPNLHAKRYGYVDFARLAGHARVHRYHVAVATVPLDGWFVRREAAAIFRDSRDVLSLSIHGNDHVRQELGRDMSEAERTATALTALRRVDSLERRSGIPVSRVMIAPHEVCSPAMMRTLAAAGFEALCFAWRVRRHPQHVVAGAQIADVVGGGLPVIPRHPIVNLNDEMVFRAFLDQPIVFGGHHRDFAKDMDLAADVARAVNALGDVRWLPLDEIAQQNVRISSSGGHVRVTLFSRRATVDLPDDAERLTVRLASLDDERTFETIVARSQHGCLLGSLGDEIPVSPGPIELILRRTDLPVGDLPSRRTSVWPLLRRGAVEVRDRSRPLVDRLRRRL